MVAALLSVLSFCVRKVLVPINANENASFLHQYTYILSILKVVVFALDSSAFHYSQKSFLLYQKRFFICQKEIETIGTFCNSNRHIKNIFLSF
jgi:hypothetical protein